MRRAMSSLLSADDARYRTGRRAATASANDAVFSCWLTCSSCEPKFFNRISLLHKYWFIPAAYAIERSVPRKTRRIETRQCSRDLVLVIGNKLQQGVSALRCRCVALQCSTSYEGRNASVLVAATPRCENRKLPVMKSGSPLAQPSCEKRGFHSPRLTGIDRVSDLL